MNIFVLDTNLEKCAQYTCDEHVIKMILEHAQMLSTACRLNGIESGYKPTHKNHPCTKWVRESLDNWLWLKELTRELNKEYKFRRGHIKNHKSWDVVKSLPIPKLPRKGLTPFVQCMSDKYKNEDAIIAYRTFYIKDKSSFATWKWGREQPIWFINGLKENYYV